MRSPEITVIIPAVNLLSDLRDCLGALQRQKSVELEILVLDRLGPDVRDPLGREFPDAKIVAMDSDATIPQMRAKGFELASADLVAVIEDHVIVPPDWASKLLQAIENGADVAGGPIENMAVEKRVDWAAFLCEYSACLPPLEGGKSSWLPGNNIVYKKSLIDQYAPVIAEGKWENRLHDAMRDDGVDLIMIPDLIVGHKMHYTFNLYMSQRYLYARSYAGGRVVGKSLPVRFLYGLAAFILPPLLFFRTVKNIRSKGRHLDQLVPSLPMLFAFVWSWGFGEVVGYWFGAGKSLSKVR